MIESECCDILVKDSRDYTGEALPLANKMNSYNDHIEMSENKKSHNIIHESMNNMSSDLPYLKLKSEVTDQIPCFDIESIPANETGSYSADDVKNYDSETINVVENINTSAYSENESLNSNSGHFNDENISLLHNSPFPCLKNENVSCNWELIDNNNIPFPNQNFMIPDFLSSKDDCFKQLEKTEDNTLSSSNKDATKDDVFCSDNSNSSSNMARKVQNIIDSLYNSNDPTENISCSGDIDSSTMTLKNFDSNELVLTNIQYDVPVANNQKFEVNPPGKNRSEKIVCTHNDENLKNKNLSVVKNEVYHVSKTHNNRDVYLGEINSCEHNTISLDDENDNCSDSGDDYKIPPKRICLESIEKNELRNFSSISNDEVDHSVKNEIRREKESMPTLPICLGVDANVHKSPAVCNETISATNFSCVKFETDDSSDIKISAEVSLVEKINFKDENDISSNHSFDNSDQEDDSSYFAFRAPTHTKIDNYKKQLMTCSTLSTPEKNQNSYPLSDNKSPTGQCSDNNNLNLSELTKHGNYDKSNFPEKTKLIPVNELQNFIPEEWNKDCDFDQVVIHEMNLKSEKCIEIANLFKRSGKSLLKLKSIHRIENRYQWLNYELKKIELTKLFGQCEEMILFHGTRVSSFNSICNTNFDWRFGGSHRGHKFGMGVSFSPIATYASHYTDQFDDGKTENKMILARVLVAKTTQGKPNMAVPPPGYDTTCNYEHKVYVKFDDFSYYPEYELCYTGKLFDYYAERMRLRELEKLASKLSSRENRMRPPVDMNHQQLFHRDDFFSSNDQQFMMPSVPRIVQIQNNIDISVNIPSPHFNTPCVLPSTPPYHHGPPVFNMSPPLFDDFPEVNIHQFQTNIPQSPPWKPISSTHEIYLQHQNRCHQDQGAYHEGQVMNYDQNNMLPPTPYMRPAEKVYAQKRKRGGKKKKRSFGARNSQQRLPSVNSPQQNNFIQQVWQPWANKPLKNKSSNKFKHGKSRY